MTSRRQFIQIVPLASAAALLAAAGSAQAAMVEETDAQAKALGYVADAARADKGKYKQFAAGQHCGSCALYQGGNAPAGKCALFPGKDVANKGWCSAYAKKA
ncbi:MAG: high-potential iron-sulfur protein [Burkholderiaceae bacterium]|nr:high-potential iron-sulfur protein [Rhodoferax sp.]MCP5285624.1 high-potential iron-sulfur protein [Burkholderiaceae bacterium]